MAEFTFAPLTPSSFLDRSAAVFADRTAIVDGERRFTYRDLSGRCRRLAGALAGEGVGREDRVAALCANSHVMLELHYAVPVLGAALVTLNTRLSADEMAGLSATRALRPGRDPRVRRPGPAPGREGGPAVLPRRRPRGLLRGLDRRSRRGEPGAGRRTPTAGDQLHQRDDGTAQGRDVPPPGRVPAGHRDGLSRPAGPGRPVPVDAADVPLQRMVLHLGRDRGRRHARVPARRGHGRDLAAAAGRGDHPFQRRADCADHDRRRSPRPEPSTTRFTWTPVARRRRRRCWPAWRRWTSP